MTAITEKQIDLAMVAWLNQKGSDRAAMRRALEAALSLPVSNAGEWQPIETAPKDGTKFDVWAINHLAYDKKSSRIVNVYWGRVCDWMGNERDDWVGAASEDIEPTHWRPLPEPPL